MNHNPKYQKSTKSICRIPTASGNHYLNTRKDKILTKLKAN